MKAAGAALTIDFSPLLPLGTIGAMAALALLLLLVSAAFFRRGLTGRALCSALFLLLFLNPSLTEEKREAVPDIAAIVVDRSPSQHNGERLKRTEEALKTLEKKLELLPGIEVRLVDSSPGNGKDGGPARETRLFDALDQALTDVPSARRAGAIFLTDGQVHDVPRDPRRFTDYGPVHTLLSGDKNEHDRQLVILEAPAYGIVSQQVTIKYKISDQGTDDRPAEILLRQNNAPAQIETVPVNTPQELRVTIDHAGQNIFDLQVAPVEKEISTANNRAPVIVNGVRDRLRVLLVSGQPHAGGRTWRNLLTSDPGVDLVHFTILREPNKLDSTPQNELSLIAFPFDELFQTKLYDFDLIIFDRYRLNRILPNYYFGNIARYVKEGGALLEASGPSFASGESVYTTELSQVLPAFPTGQVFDQPFKPTITETGKRHPVTEGLMQATNSDGSPVWGSWLRQVSVSPRSGEVVMAGVNSLPLLILDHVGKGRVAQLASDQIWLWSRGFEGGGPQVELLRRLAHWLMKEPELEENALDVSVEGGSLLIRRRALNDDPLKASVIAPDGEYSEVDIKPDSKGGLEARLPAGQLGVYTVNDGTQERFALSGALNPPEFSGILTTPEKMEPLVKASKGAVIWLASTPAPDVRLLPPGRRYGGPDWLGLRRSHSFNVTGVKSRPLLPEAAWAAALLALLIGAWWHEGKRKRPA